MANALLPLARQKIGAHALDWTAGTWKVQYLNGALAYDPTWEFLADIPAPNRIGAGTAITGRVVLLDGVFDADDVIPGPVVPIATTVAAMAIYRDSGAEATSEILYFADTNEDSTPISRVGAGAAVAVVWSNLADRIFKI